MFYCHAQTDLFKNSLTAPVFLVNVLMSQAIYRDNEKMLRYLKRREEVQRFEEAEYKRRDEP